MRLAKLARDVASCEALVTDLDSDLLQDVLYWHLSIGGPRSAPYPQLTLGRLLMRLHHLEILSNQLSPELYQKYVQAHAAGHH